ncbi:MAG: hypothetical protein LBK72_06850 [Bifidobacteriaceae bacterium]|nr:hypothetical protein [Bifidobacteriaceae bacterium]
MTGLAKEWRLLGVWTALVVLLVDFGAIGSGAAIALGAEVLPCTDESKPMIVVDGRPTGTTVEPGATLRGAAVGDYAADGLVRVDYLAWLRDGQPTPGSITGGGSSSVRVKGSDLGSTFVQVATMSYREPSGCPAILATTQTWRVLARSEVTARLSKGSVTAGGDAVLKVKVAAKGVDRPTGKVRVSVDNAKSKTVWLDPEDRGTVDVKLRALSRGTHTAAVSFTDTTGKIQDGVSRAVKVKAK